MNTKQIFCKHTVFVIFALLVALWLPSVSIAQDYSNNRADERSAGFAETDPAVEQSQDIVTFLNASNSRVIETRVGFTETDPAVQQFQDAVNFLHSSNNRVINGTIGFAETDPAGSYNQPREGTNYQPAHIVSVEMVKAD
jgi:hypothetical protein